VFKKKNSEVEAPASDRYLITYADLITLLLGLFVILYASSQVDEEKYKEFSEAFKDYFKSPKEQVLTGGNGILEGHKQGIPEPILPNPSEKSFEDFSKNAENALRGFIENGSLDIKINKAEIVVSLPEELLFRSGKANIQPGGQIVLDTIARFLTGMPFQLTVDGHTDATPIKTFRYESNWHLSVSRATNVAYRLVQKGVPEPNLVIRGFGAQRPITDNASNEARAKNRRVEITISQLSEETPSTEGYEYEESF
jgi:chemotaxis protein MotB